FLMYYCLNSLAYNLLLMGIINEAGIVVYNVILLVFLLYFLQKEGKSSGKFKIQSLLISLLILYLFSFSFDLYYSDFENFRPVKFKLGLDNLSINYIFFQTVILIPIIEEILFRGLILRESSSKLKIIFNIISSSFLFSASHFYFIYTTNQFQFDLVQFLNLFLLGTILSLVKIRYGIFYAIISHIFYNFIIYANDEGVINLFLLDYVDNTYFYPIYFITELILILIIGNLFRHLFCHKNMAE